MIYVKANVERIVNDANEAQKLIAQGYKPLKQKATVETAVETQKEPEEAPKRRRRR